MIGCDCAVCHVRRSARRPHSAVDLHRRSPDRRVDPGRHRHRSAAAGAALRPPARRRHPLHPQPRRPRAGPRRGAAVQRAAGRSASRATAMRGRCGRSGGRSPTSSRRTTPQGGGVPQLDLFDVAGAFSSGRRASHAGAAVHGTRRSSASGSAPFAYLTDCSAHPRRSRGRCSTACDVLVLDALRRPAASRRTSASPRRSRSSSASARARLLHAHLPRSAARRDLRALPEGVELAYDGLR